MSYEKDQLEALAGGTGLTSASASTMIASQIATAIAPYATSASVSAAITAAVAPYVTSDSLSAALLGAAKTALLGSVSISAGLVSTIGFSGSWSDYYMLDLLVSYKTNGTSNTASIALYTDGGTTPFLNVNLGTVSNAQTLIFDIRIALGGGQKSVMAWKSGTSGAFFTATANTGFVNCVRIAHGTAASATLSTGVAQLTGYRR